jgi:hypothetical protein
VYLSRVMVQSVTEVLPLSLRFKND